MSLVALDGRHVARDTTWRCDVVVVGSGPGGATVARALAAAGADVVVVEAGPWVQPHEFSTDALRSISTLYTDGGFTFTRGRPSMQVLSGRALGGTSVVNSAICWRLPRHVYHEWVTDDPALADRLDWEELDQAGSEVERVLGVGPTEPMVAGANNLLMARGARRLGLDHRPTRRNVVGCQGSARCNQGCPTGAKLSMDRGMLPEAVADGARIVTSVQVNRILRSAGAAVGVAGTAAGGGQVRVEAGDAVVIAAGAIHTPVLLLKNRIAEGPVGQRLQCHPGLTVAGRFDEPVHQWRGATQGHEVTGLLAQRIKLEALALDPQLLAARLDRLGSALTEEIGRLSHWATWDAAIRSSSLGSVAPGRKGPKIRFTLDAQDVGRIRKAVCVLGRLFLAAGAVEVAPGVAGFDRRVVDEDALHRLEAEGPSDPRAYRLAVSHLFGTCRLGSDPRTSVVGPDFRHHVVDRLHVADASVLPTNLGVNPQITIMAMASVCARRIIEGSDRWTAGARRPGAGPAQAR